VIGVLITLFFGILVFGPLYASLPAQVVGLIIAVGWHVTRTSIRETWNTVKAALPFVATLLLFGVIFQLARLQGRSDWLTDSAIKCMIFPSSLLCLRAALSYITYLDILALPLSMDRRFDLITIKAAFGMGGQALSRFSWYLDTYPYLASEPRPRRLQQRYTSLIIAIYLYLYQETENAHLLLRNRYRHLHEEAP
jgi:hypothetical protein